MNDDRLVFIDKLEALLDVWGEMKLKIGQGGLSQETHFALRHTVITMRLLVTHLLTVDKFNYVLLGKFQIDNFEFRFSQCRQLSGSNYHVSVREIVKSEKKMKIASLKSGLGLWLWLGLGFGLG